MRITLGLGVGPGEERTLLFWYTSAPSVLPATTRMSSASSMSCEGTHLRCLLLASGARWWTCFVGCESVMRCVLKGSTLVCNQGAGDGVSSSSLVRSSRGISRPWLAARSAWRKELALW